SQAQFMWSARPCGCWEWVLMENSTVTETRPEQSGAIAPIENRKYGILSRLRSYLFFDPLIWGYTVVFGLTSIPFGFFDKDGSILHAFARAWSKTIMKTIFSPMRIVGLEKIDPTKPHVYAVNHGSAFDIPVLYAYLPFQFRLVIKKELRSVPIVGGRVK